MKPRHVKLVSRYSARYSIRGGAGLVFLVLSLTFGLMVANQTLQPIEALIKVQQRRGVELTPKEAITQIKDPHDPIGSRVHAAVGWVLGSSKVAQLEDPGERAAAERAIERWTGYLLDEHPAPLSAILMILLWGWPFVAVLGAFNLFSGDIQSRGLRYQLIRTDRSSIFFGRVLGTVMSQVVVLLVLVLTIVVYMGARLPFYGWGALLGWGLQGGLMLVLLTLPYIALAAWLSAAIDSPMLSLVAVSGVVGGVPLLALLGGSQWEPLDYLTYLLPWGCQLHLQHFATSHVLAAAAACLGYSAVFLFVGHRHFLKRDL